MAYRTATTATKTTATKTTATKTTATKTTPKKNFVLTNVHIFEPSEDSNLVGFVSFDYMGISFNGCRVMTNREGNWFLSPPCRQYEKDGEIRYSKYYYIPGGHEVESLALDAFFTEYEKKMSGRE